jgi:2-dehydro-3-deoxyphosphogluconate aldolase/(4S)-4-hydroxy-2-oxoglutarate aldolase
LEGSLVNGSEKIAKIGVFMKKCIPVVVIRDMSEADVILSSLRDIGILCAEITFRSDCAAEAIAYARRHYPDMEIGAGTVISAQQCRDALEAGAQFIVSPGLSTAVASVCQSHNVPYYPGCVTPTEIMQALDLGITTVKFFPANIYGGLAALKALSAPFPQVKFIPTGGVDRGNIDEFFAFDKVYAVGGSFFVKEALEERKKKETSQ